MIQAPTSFGQFQAPITASCRSLYPLGRTYPVCQISSIEAKAMAS